MRYKFSRIFLQCIVIVLITFSDTYSQRKMSEEAVIFRSLKDGVFTVFGDEGKGSGFLVDSLGLILTNQHVVANSSHIRVQLNDSIKVSGIILLEDKQKDVAAILINPSIVNGLPILKIAPPRNELAFEGERVIAIGSPLNQEKILTSGIISGLKTGAIISDVNLNHGNSGGPLVNMDGEVIAINTFGDFSAEGGPGVSGSIPINIFYAFIDSALALAEKSAPPDPKLLSVMPKIPYPLWALEKSASQPKYDTNPYLISKLISTGKFNVLVETPPYIYHSLKTYELEISKKRKSREQKGNASKSDKFDPYQDLKEWQQYLGQYSPVVGITIIPKFGQTSSSSWANALGAFASGLSGKDYRGSYEYEFKGDLKDAILKINGKEAGEIMRGMAFQPLDFLVSDYYGTYEGADLARSGRFVYSPNVFAPIDTIWPLATLEIWSIDDPDKPIQIVIPRKTMERIWSDFEPFREQVNIDSTRLILK